MTCHPIQHDEQGRPIGFLCTVDDIFDFEGYLFEVHGYLGPHPIRRTDGSPRTRIPAGFWRAWSRFRKLSTEEQEAYRVERRGPRGGV